MIVCCLGLFEEGEVEHIISVRSSFLDFTASFVKNKQESRATLSMHDKFFKRLPCFRTSDNE